ncbi:MAG: N-methyl-L-tryptophan oxidase [Candidatus Dormibacteraceae bacterium]
MTAVDAEVCVVGAGSMGSQALWQLALRGVDVIGIERFQPGHDRGSGHGENRIVRSCHQEGPQYAPLIEAAFPLWRELARESGEDVLTENGMLYIAPAGRGSFAADQAIGDAKSFPYEVLDRAQASARFPQHRYAPDDAAFLDLQGGFVRPELAITSAVRLAERHGARLRADLQAERVTERGDHVEVATAVGTIRARRAIVAAGAWTPKVLPQAALPVVVERRVMLWFRARDPEAFTPERFPAFIRESSDGVEWYGFPSLDGKTVKAAIHGGGGVATEPDHLDREVHRSDVEPLAEQVRRSLPGLDPEPVRGAACMYANTRDGHFVLGFVPGSERLILLGPMLGHGFKFATAVGQIGADLATEGTSRLPIDAFSPARFA